MCGAVTSQKVLCQENIARELARDRSIMPPCQAACPLHMDIREYVDLVAQGKIMEALQVIRRDNPFPAICAYVCTHPCEEACRRSQIDTPVAIRSLKRFAVEFGGDSMIQAQARTTRKERIAIVGSGPAGLSCAYYLRVLGYRVTVFEAHSEIGGMMRVGIPQYRLPREVLDIEIKRLLQMGVEIRTDTPVISLDLLFEMGYNAIFLTLGAHRSLRMGIEGEESSGVLDGATFLREINLGLKPELGDRIAVVGGGNVAVDAARTARRLGARHIDILYRRTRAEMPADDEEVKQALEEGIKIRFLVAPVRIHSENGQLTVTCIKMKLGEADSSGRRSPGPVEGSEYERKYDAVITAIGQQTSMPDDFHVRAGRSSTIHVDPVTLITNRSGVFAGGDAVTGPSTVTEALAAGRLASRRIDEYLQHRYPAADNGQKVGIIEGALLPETIEMIRKIERREPSFVPATARVGDFRLIEQVYGWEDAANEARRCLRCGMGAEILFTDKCASCLTCIRVCPYNVPQLTADGTVIIPPEQCLACGICVAECPARAIVLRKPQRRRQVAEELEHVLRVAAAQPQLKPVIVGFCCQYGLFGTGALGGLWREIGAGVYIVPVPCVAKVEEQHMLRAFEAGAEGVFIAGCNDHCSRENTAHWIALRVEEVKNTLGQIGMERGRVKVLGLNAEENDTTAELARFIEQVSGYYLTSILVQEVTGDSSRAKTTG